MVDGANHTSYTHDPPGNIPIGAYGHAPPTELPEKAHLNALASALVRLTFEI
jgi:hypothetical protein